MKKFIFPIIGVLFVGVILGFTFGVSAEENLIPSWIKTTAGFWVNDQISDSEFINALQFLLKERILVIPNPTIFPDMPIAPNPNDVPLLPQPFIPSSPTPVTERIDGPFALHNIDEMSVFTVTADKEKIAELLLKEADESEFLLGVLSTSWDGIIGDGDNKVSINGTDIALIPFSCDYDGTWMYNVNIQKQTEDELLMVFVFKNGVQINSSQTESPFGIVALDGDCTNPPSS